MKKFTLFLSIIFSLLFQTQLTQAQQTIDFQRCGIDPISHYTNSSNSTAGSSSWYLTISQVSSVYPEFAKIEGEVWIQKRYNNDTTWSNPRRLVLEEQYGAAWFGPTSQATSATFYQFESDGDIQVTVWNSLTSKNNGWNGTGYQNFNQSSHPTTWNGTTKTLNSNIPANSYIRFERKNSLSANGNCFIDNIHVNNGVLPIELISFSGYTTINEIVLKWKTKTESNNYGFDIQKKSNEKWESIGFVEGHGTSSTPHEYSYSDPLKELRTSSLKYRLVQKDRDGTQFVSKEILFTSPPSLENLVFTYPNPLRSNTSATLTLNLAGPESVSIDLYDSQGKKSKTITNNEFMEKGTHYRSIDLTGLPMGLYMVHVTYNGSIRYGRILIQ